MLRERGACSDSLGHLHVNPCRVAVPFVPRARGCYKGNSNLFELPDGLPPRVWLLLRFEVSRIQYAPHAPAHARLLPLPGAWHSRVQLPQLVQHVQIVSG